MSYAPRDPEVARWRASVARRAQSYADDHPRMVEARKSLAYAKIAAQVAKVVATWPDPTPEQRAGITKILADA